MQIGVKRGVKCENQTAESIENTVNNGLWKSKHIIVWREYEKKKEENIDLILPPAEIVLLYSGLSDLDYLADRK